MKSTIKTLSGNEVIVIPSGDGQCMVFAMELPDGLSTVTLTDDEASALMFGMECALSAMRTRRERAAAIKALPTPRQVALHAMRHVNSQGASHAPSL